MSTADPHALVIFWLGSFIFRLLHLQEGLKTQFSHICTMTLCLNHISHSIGKEQTERQSLGFTEAANLQSNCRLQNINNEFHQCMTTFLVSFNTNQKICTLTSLYSSHPDIPLVGSKFKQKVCTATLLRCFSLCSKQFL